MNKEDYQEILEKMEKATGNEVFCDVMCRFPYELNEEQLTEVCERCPLTEKGHWILADEQNKEDVENDNYRFICSECQCSDIHAKGAKVPYCWKCGAKMAESEECMAIKALEQEPKTDNWSIKDVADTLEKHGLIAEQEPCEDAIDRAEAMMEIMMFEGNVKSNEEDIYIKVSDAVQLLRELPSVTPTQEFILDKIRAEIDDLTYYWCEVNPNSVKEDVLQILDKYKAESEEVWSDK